MNGRMVSLKGIAPVREEGNSRGAGGVVGFCFAFFEHSTVAR